MAIDIIRGRQNPAVLTNRTGGAVSEGDVVIVDTANAIAFDSTVVEGQSAECVGVVLEDIANGASGRVAVGGEVAQVNLDGAAAIGDWLKTDGVALQGTPQAAPGAGCFGQALEASATPRAITWPAPLQAPGANTLDQAYDQGGAGVGRSITATDGQVDVSDDGIDVANIELYDTTELTIDGAGAITRTQVYHRIDTAGDAGTDNLDTINGGTNAGELLVIRPENDARTIVVRHNVGNIWLIGEADISLEDTEDHLLLAYDGVAYWCSVGDGGGAGGAPADAAYLIFGTDATLSAEINSYDFYGRNLVKNSPGQIVTDGAEPQWWDDVANATITDEDAAGEACSDLFERVFKVVTTADDVYGYGTATFADEELLDAGATVVSFGVWVWCSSANVASIGIYGTNLGLQESAQHTGGSGWELLTVENQTLNGADASIQYRLICDTGTAFFAAPMLNVGTKSLQWRPRGIKFQLVANVAQASGTTGDVAWSDTDCTANTDPLACLIAFRLQASEPNGTMGSRLWMAHSDTIVGSDQAIQFATIHVAVLTMSSWAILRCDDGQVVRYTVTEEDADNDVTWGCQLTGYWMWE